jgi:hypothetical protein
MTEIAELIQSVGPFVALTVYFVWQSSTRESRLLAAMEKSNAESIEREKSLSLRIDGLQRELSDELASLVRETTQVIRDNTEVMSQLKHLIPKP